MFSGDLFDESFKRGLPLLVISIASLAAAFFFYSQLKLSLFKLADLTFVISALDLLYSQSSILFIVFLAASFSFAAFFAFTLNRVQAAVLLLLGIFTAGIFSFLYPLDAFAFFLFAIPLGLTSLLTSNKKPGFSKASNAVGMAFTFLTILAFIGAFLAVQSNYAAYQDQFLSGVTKIAPVVASKVIPICSQAIGNVDAKQVIDKNQFEVSTRVTYDSYRAALVESLPLQLSQSVPVYNELPKKSKDQLVNSGYEESLKQTQAALKSIQKQLDAQASSVKTQSLSEVKLQLSNFQEYQTLMQYLPVVIALIVIFILGIAMFFVKLLTGIFNFVLSLIMKFNSKGEK